MSDSFIQPYDPKHCPKDHQVICLKDKRIDLRIIDDQIHITSDESLFVKLEREKIVIVELDER